MDIESLHMISIQGFPWNEPQVSSI